jgi:hypothetical protein
MEMFLAVFSGIAWSVVYVILICQGFKHKTYGMPLFALSLNFAWETINSFNDLVLQLPGPLDLQVELAGYAINVQGVVNACWAVLDAVILVTYFKYGRERCSQQAQRYFVPWSILAFILGFALQFAFFFEFGPKDGPVYSAFAQNVVMSILFIVMLFSREDTKGQSLVLAVAKWLGTLAPTLLAGFILQFDIYVVLCGTMCSVLDCIYMILLARRKRSALS